MSNHRSADEVAKNNARLMGPELGEIFTALSNDLTLLSWQFQELKELYGGATARLEVMNRSAPFFFWLLQRTWREECLLGIARIVGPAKSMGKANLSIQQLPRHIADSALRHKVGELISAAVERSKFALDWRNKRIAHRDLDHALKRTAQPLPSATLDELGTSLDAIARVLNTVESHLANGTTLYKNSPISDGVIDLLYVVRDGLRLEDQRQQRLEGGDYRSEDWGDDEPAL